MYEGTLPRIEWKYNYGIDVLFSALREISYNKDSPPRTKALQRVADCSTVLELILKKSLFRNALVDIAFFNHIFNISYSIKDYFLIRCQF